MSDKTDGDAKKMYYDAMEVRAVLSFPFLPLLLFHGDTNRKGYFQRHSISPFLLSGMPLVSSDLISGSQAKYDKRNVSSLRHYFFNWKKQLNSTCE